MIRPFSRIELCILMVSQSLPGLVERRADVLHRGVAPSVLDDVHAARPLGTTYCTLEIDTSEIIMNCQWHFPTNGHLSAVFPKDDHFSSGCSL